MKHSTHLLLLLSLSGCAQQATRVPLQALPSSELGTGQLDVRASVELEFTAMHGWDMVLDMQLMSDQVRPLVDLSRVLLRSDEQRWVPCSLPPEDEPDHLRLRMREGESLHLVLRCVQVQRPARRLELRLPISGAGGKGYLDLAFTGVENADDNSAWELD
jgi:hypothetical protein